MSKFVVTIDGYSFDIDLGEILPGEKKFHVNVDGELIEVILADRGEDAGNPSRFIIDGRPYEVSLDRDSQWIRSQWGTYQTEIQDLDLTELGTTRGDGRIKAPIPGQIASVLVAVGDNIQVGQPLMILEAMKMENEIRATRSGKIEFLNVRPGQTVALNQVLVEIV